MKRLLIPALIVVIFLSLALFTQTGQTATDYIARTFKIALLNPPQPVTNASVSVSGNPGPASYFYWIVTQVSVGASSPAGPFVVSNAPNTLSVLNFNQISWATVPGATYDVLRTRTSAPPSGACNCAVATGVTGNSISDQSNSLNTYTVNTLDPSGLMVTIQNFGAFLGITGNVVVSGTLGSKKDNGVFIADQFCSTPGILDQTCIQNAINAAASQSGATPGGMVFISGNETYNNTATVTMKYGVRVVCDDPYSSIINYSGSSSAFLLDSIVWSGIENCQIQLGNSVTAIGIDMQNTTGNNEWNVIRNVTVQNVPAMVSGQIGLRFLTSTNNANYWNEVQGFHTLKIDTGMWLTNLGAFATNGSNDNWLSGLTFHFYTTGLKIDKFAQENKVAGVACSASGNSAANTCIVIGDGTNAANFNTIIDVTADNGANGTAFNVQANAVSNYLEGITDQDGQASIDNGTTTRLGYHNSSVQPIENPQFVACKTQILPVAGDALSLNCDALHWAHFSNVSWGLRIGQLNSGVQWLGVGINKTANDNTYQAFTGNAGAVNHTIVQIGNNGIVSFLWQTHQTDGTTLSPATFASFDPTTGLATLQTAKAIGYQTTTNCSSSGGTCSAAPAGSVTIAAAATTIAVGTTAVTANSQIFVQEDPSLGTKLGVTCNTTTGRLYTITSRTAGTSFVITASAAPTTNPACLSYFIEN